jgi:hypothetical protein
MKKFFSLIAMYMAINYLVYAVDQIRMTTDIALAVFAAGAILVSFFSLFGGKKEKSWTVLSVQDDNIMPRVRHDAELKNNKLRN